MNLKEYIIRVRKQFVDEPNLFEIEAMLEMILACLFSIEEKIGEDLAKKIDSRIHTELTNMTYSICDRIEHEMQKFR